MTHDTCTKSNAYKQTVNRAYKQNKQQKQQNKQANKQTNKQTNKRTNEQTNTQTRNGRINATLHVKSFCSGQMNANKLAQQ
jgi:hypothetical protein